MYNVFIARNVKGLPVNRILLGLVALLLSGSTAGAWCTPWGPPSSNSPPVYYPVPTYSYAPSGYYVSPIIYYATPAAVAQPAPTYTAPTAVPVQPNPPAEPIAPKPKKAETTFPKKVDEFPQPKKTKTPVKRKEPIREEKPMEPLARLQIDQFLIDRNSKSMEDVVVEAKVGFFNHSDRDLTLIIQGEEVTLPKDEYVTLRLPRDFKWAEKGESSRTVTIPADAEGLEIVFRK